MTSHSLVELEVSKKVAKRNPNILLYYIQIHIVLNLCPLPWPIPLSHVQTSFKFSAHVVLIFNRTSKNLFYIVWTSWWSYTLDLRIKFSGSCTCHAPRKTCQHEKENQRRKVCSQGSKWLDVGVPPVHTATAPALAATLRVCSVTGICYDSAEGD